MTALVSVIVPTFNRATVLSNTLQSILEQSYSNLEIIVVDDGSKDDTRQVVESFKDNRIVYHCIANSGRPSVPRNVGLEFSTGDFVAFCDDDDTWLPEKVAKQLAAFSIAKDIVLVATNAYNFPAKGGNFFYDFERLLGGNFLVNSSVMVTRAALDSAGKFDEDMRLKAVEDYEFWLRILYRSRGRGYKLRERLTVYNIATVGIGRDYTPFGIRILYRKHLCILRKFEREAYRPVSIQKAKNRHRKIILSSYFKVNFKRTPEYLLQVWASQCFFKTKVKLSLGFLMAGRLPFESMKSEKGCE